VRHILHKGIEISLGDSFGLRQKFLYGTIYEAMGKEGDGQRNEQQQKNRQKNDFIPVITYQRMHVFQGNDDVQNA
jgi:hypothetical protein